MTAKPVPYIDMDNVLVNFQSGIDRLDEMSGIFDLMKSILRTIYSE